MSFNAGDIESSLTLDRSPFHRGLSQARAEAERFERNPVTLRVDLDRSELDKLGGALGSARQSTRSGIKVPVSADPESIRRIQGDVEEIARNTETTARRSGNRLARLLLNPLVVQLGLLPGIAMASTAAAGLALGALPLAFGAIAVAAVKNNEELRSSWSSMWQDMKAEAEAISGPLLDVFNDLSNDIFGTWRQLRPELAQIFRDSVPLIESFTDGVLGMAEEAVPRFGTAIQQSGPAMRGFEQLLISIGVGLGDMSINMAQNSQATGQSLALLGGFIQNLLADVGSLINLFTTWWSEVGPNFNRVFDQATDVLLAFTEGGLRGAGDGMTILLGVVEGLLDVFGPFADIFGQIGGTALALIGTWKLLAGSMGLVGKAWALISPVGMMGRLDGVTGAIGRMATAGGNLTTKLTGNAMAGAQFTNVTNKVGTAVTRAASALPLIGAAIIGVQAVMDHFFPSADDLATKLAQGGSAAEEARSKMYGLEGGYSRTNLAAAMFAERQEDVAAALEKHYAGMTEVERAQSRLTQAENDYQYALDKFGPSSEQAADAQDRLAMATDEVTSAQEDAADATKTHTDRMIEQTNLMLGAIGARLNYSSALLQLEEQEKAVTQAIKDHGAGSIEARQADVSYQQTLLSVINSLGERVKAENIARGETQATELASAAMRREIARLAVEAGTNLPPALAEMASKLTDAELKALGVTRQVDKTGTAIYRLPPGKNLKFPTNAPIAKRDVDALAVSVNNVNKGPHWVQYYLNAAKTGDWDTGTKSNLGDILGVPGRAEGGPVNMNQPYWVGEKGLPELFFPNVDGFILNGADSAKVFDQAGNRNTSNSKVQFSSSGQDDSTPGIETLAAALVEAIEAVFRNAKLRFEKGDLVSIVSEQTARNDRR